MKTLLEAAVDVLNTANSLIKVDKTYKFGKMWREKLFKGGVGCINCCPNLQVPNEPALPEGVEIVAVNKVPKRGTGQSLPKRIALLHSFAHIEFAAVNLAWDMIARFGLYPGQLCLCKSAVTQESSDDLESIRKKPSFPIEFYDDWVRIAIEEAKHHQMLCDRLKALGSHYGALPGHAGLWQSALTTADDPLARFAIVHMVHEARGLDRHPPTMEKFKGIGDMETVEIMNSCIYPDEITHVRSGKYWFMYLCTLAGLNEQQAIQEFQHLVRERFYGPVKPPFNTEARNQAGLTEDWYLALVK